MRKLTLALILFGVLFGLFSCSTPAAPPTNGDGTMTEQMLNNVMTYIREKHPDAAPFIRDKVSWSNISTDKRIGYTRSTYTCDSWTVTIGHAATAEVRYEVRAEYKNEMIVWTGTIKDSTITEEGYTKK
jgi:hypothetical protein